MRAFLAIELSAGVRAQLATVQADYESLVALFVVIVGRVVRLPGHPAVNQQHGTVRGQNQPFAVSSRRSKSVLHQVARQRRRGGVAQHPCVAHVDGPHLPPRQLSSQVATEPLNIG